MCAKKHHLVDTLYECLSSSVHIFAFFYSLVIISLSTLNVQIIEEDASLVEIGPRLVLNLIKVFQGSFGGPTLYENPEFQSPNMVKPSWNPTFYFVNMHFVGGNLEV